MSDEDRPERLPGWPALLLAVACGFLLGAVVTVAAGALGEEPAPRVATRTVTVPPPVRTTDSTTIQTTEVPDLVGQPLDLALERIERASFEADVEGGGLFGVVEEENWEVVAQRPDAGEQLELRSTVQVVVARR